MFDSESDFLPPTIPREEELPEAFDRTVKATPKPRAKRGRGASHSAEALLEEFIDKVQEQLGLSKGALRFYQADLAAYLCWLQAHGAREMQQVSRSLVEQYAHDLHCGQMPVFSTRRPVLNAKFLASSTIARKLMAVREWHQFLARRYKWPNPAALLPDVPSPTNASLILSAEQIKALLAIPDVYSVSGLRDYAILCLICDGMSPPQIKALLYQNKEGKWPFGERAQQALQDYITRARPLLLARLRQKGLGSRYLFFTNRGTPFSPTRMQQMVRRYAREAQLPEWVSATRLSRIGLTRRACGAAPDEESIGEIAASPRAAQLQHAYAKAHPRA